MSEGSRSSLPVRIFLKFVLNAILVWFLAKYLGLYFNLTGGMEAYIVIGALLTLMNMLVRPLLAVVTFPLKMFVTILAIIIVQAVFVQLTVMIVQRMDTSIVTLQVNGGLWGWVVIAVVLGVGNWLMKITLK